MARDYIIINGVNSLTIPGLAIKTLPPISKTAQRIMREEIDGRDGDINTYLGYSAYDKTLEVGLFGNYDIDQIIKFFNTQGTITFSNEPDKFYNFQILDRIDYTKLVKFREAMINIHCQPFKYPTEETPLEEEYEYVTGTGTDVTLNNTAAGIFNKFDLLGNTEQTQYTGKNKSLFGNTTGSGITFDGNKITIVNPTNYKFADTWNLKNDTSLSGKTFTIYARVNGTIQSNYIDLRVAKTGNGYAYMCKIDSSRQTTFKDYIVVNQVTLGSNEVFTGVAVEVNGTPTANLEVDFMIVEGSYTAQTIGDYEPYVGGIPSPNPNYPQDIHVVSGENSITITGRNLANVEDFTYTLNNTYYRNDYIDFKIKAETTYTISYDATTSVQPFQAQVGLKNSNGYYAVDVGSKTNLSNGRVYITFRVPQATIDNYSNNLGMRYIRYGAMTTANCEVKNVTLVEGTDTTYIPYEGETYPLSLGNLEMASIPNTINRDYFYKDNEGNWYKKALIEKIVIDGTESTWVENSAKKGLFQITLTNTKNSPNTINAVSDWLRGAKGNDIGAATITSAINNTIATYNGNRLFFRIDQYKNNLAGLKTYIQSNNLTAYYLYGTPVDVAITNETLIEQLEAIWNATSYRGQTNITQVSNDLPFMMEVSALKLGSDHLEINNQGNIYSRPTIKLEGTGIVQIYLNEIQAFEVDLTETNKITIDTEAMEAYKTEDNTLANRLVTGDYSKFKLAPGTNDVRFSGALTTAEVTRYKRWL